MHRSDVFRRRITLGFAILAFLAVFVSAASIYALRSVIKTKDLVLSDHARDLLDTRALQVASEQNASRSRSYLITQDPEHLQRARAARARFMSLLEALRSRFLQEEERRRLEAVARAEKVHQAALEEAISMERENTDPEALADLFERKVAPRRLDLTESFRDLIALKEVLLGRALDESALLAGRATGLLLGMGLSSAVLAGALFLLATRTLRKLARAEAEIRALNRNLELRVQARTRELTQAVQELEGFAYTVAHNLRAPLRASAGFSRLLMEDLEGRLQERDVEHLRRIERASEQMDLLIRDLLDYSRLSYSPVKSSPTALEPVVREAFEAATPEAAARRAEIRVDGALPWVWGQDALLRECLRNLLSNALKFVSPGVAPKITIRAEARGEWTRVWVEDNGIGIAPEHREKIFGVFERLHRPEDFPGTGIGLAIVKKIVQRLGGQAGVESRPGAGSQFWIELRTAQAQAHPVAAARK